MYQRHQDSFLINIFNVQLNLMTIHNILNSIDVNLSLNHHHHHHQQQQQQQ